MFWISLKSKTNQTHQLQLKWFTFFMILDDRRSPKREKTAFKKIGRLWSKEWNRTLYYVIFIERKYIKISGSKRAKTKITSETFFRNAVIVTDIRFVFRMLMQMFCSNLFRMMTISMYRLEQYWEQYRHRQKNIDYDIFFFHSRNRIIFNRL